MRKAIQLVCVFVFGCMVGVRAADSVEAALATVRDVKADMFSRESSTLGTLPGPAEYVAVQLRCRPVDQPTDLRACSMTFDTATRQRAAALAPAAMTGNGRSGVRTMPLGITGAQVSEFIGKTEFLVVHVIENTPAAGKLEKDDIIIGANGHLFEDVEDPRPELGYALAASQTPVLKGILTLHVVREGEPLNVAIDLGNRLPYSKTWPYDCEKSKQVRAAALRFVIDHYPWHRYDFWTPLFLMASGDDDALELARRHLYGKLHVPQYYEGPLKGEGSWGCSYNLIGLCEYYLLTGDSAVLPEIGYKARIIAHNQYPSGGWSHGAGGGYGEINNVGLSSMMGLILARECGVQIDEDALAKGIRYFGRYCGSNLPYGQGAPAGRAGRMDNGMNSESAVVFNLLGEKAMSERWARSVCYMWMGRERGHAEAIFSGCWGPIGAALAPREEFHMFMQQQLWAYELGRARDGGIVFLRGGRWSYPNMTAAMGLFLYLPEQRLRVLGAAPSVFGRPLTGEAETLRELFKQKQWRELVSARSRLTGRDLSKDAREILLAYERLDAHVQATLKLIADNISAGRRATARDQLDALARLLGEARPEMAELRTSLGDNVKDSPKQKPAPMAMDPTWPRVPGKGYGGGFACSPDYIRETNARGFEGMPPEKIARYLAHFSGGPASGAVAALAARGTAVVPLLKTLIGDSHPYIRAGAVATLGELYKFSDDKGEAPKMTDALGPVMKLVASLQGDPHPEVQRALSEFVGNLRVETALTHKVAFTCAAHPDPSVRSRALAMARGWLQDKEAILKIAMLVSASPEGNTPSHWNIAHMMVQRFKGDPATRKTIPVMAEAIRNQCNSKPYRGFFSDGAQSRAFEVMEAVWDADVEGMDHVVEALCRSYVRVPIHDYKGWVRTRELAWKLLNRCTKPSADRIRETAAREKQWLATVDDAKLKETTERDPAQSRAKLSEYISNLEALAAKLDAQ